MSSFLQERFGKRSSSRTDLYNSLISVRRQRLNYALNDSLIGEEVLSEPLGRMKGIVRTCVSGWSSGGLTRRREDERALGLGVTAASSRSILPFHPSGLTHPLLQVVLTRSDIR